MEGARGLGQGQGWRSERDAHIESASGGVRGGMVCSWLDLLLHVQAKWVPPRNPKVQQTHASKHTIPSTRTPCSQIPPLLSPRPHPCAPWPR